MTCEYPPMYRSPGLTDTAAARLAAPVPTRRPGGQDSLGHMLNPLDEAGESSSDVAIESSLPPLALSRLLVNAYFDHLHPYHSNAFLHPGTTRRHLSEGTISPTLLLAICAASARYVGPRLYPKAENLYGEGLLTSAIVKDWRDRAMLSLVGNDEISLDSACAALILNKDANHDGRWNVGSTLAAVATRHAAKLGLLRDTTGEIWSVDVEQRRRIAVAVFCADYKAAAGDQRLVNWPSLSTALALPCEDSHFEEGSSPIDPAGALIFRSAASIAGYNGIGISGHYARLINIRHSIHSYSRSLVHLAMKTPWDDQSDFCISVNRLNEWLESLPSRLADTTENVFARIGTRSLHPFIMLHLHHYMLRCELWRVGSQEYLLSDPLGGALAHDWVEQARLLALDGAQQIVRSLVLVADASCGRDEPLLDPSLPAMCFAGARTLLHNANRQVSSRELNTLWDAGNNCRPFFPSSIPVLDELHSLLSQNDASRPVERWNGTNDHQIPSPPWLIHVMDVDARERANPPADPFRDSEADLFDEIFNAFVNS